MQPLANRIFISKTPEETIGLAEWLHAQHDLLISHSFISFEACDFEVQGGFDVLFFGSPRSVIFYESAQGIPQDKSIACVGETTASVPRNHGIEPDFTGDRTRDIEAVAEQFKVWLGKRHVLFPTSALSLRTFQAPIPEEQRAEVIVYRTLISSMEIPACDVYVFTSPSNADGFFQSNVLPSGVRIIAWGKSTHRALTNHGVSQHVEIVEYPSLEALTTML